MTAESDTRVLVRERSGGMCEVRAEKVCRGQGESMHHRNKVSQGGLWSPSNIVHVCGGGTTGCHGWIEANPASSRKKGLWLYRGQYPLTTPATLVFRGLRGVYLLDDEGSIQWLSQRALARLS